MSTLLHVILDRAPALTTLAQECKGCPGTLCKGCHGTEHALGCHAERSSAVSASPQAQPRPHLSRPAACSPRHTAQPPPSRCKFRRSSAPPPFFAAAQALHAWGPIPGSREPRQVFRVPESRVFPGRPEC